MKFYHYLYQTTNLLNNKIYIGVHSTKNLDDGYIGSGISMLYSIKKYGKENFKKEILGYFDTRELLFEAELKIVNQEFVERLDTYNIQVGGGGPPAELALTTIERISLTQTGKRHTPETKKKISLIRKGKRHTAETKRKISLAQQGENGHNFGKHHTAETKNKMSLVRKGRKQKIVNCPHCSKSGGLSAMTRWHFSKCKQKKELLQ